MRQLHNYSIFTALLGLVVSFTGQMTDANNIRNLGVALVLTGIVGVLVYVVASVVKRKRKDD